MPDYLSDTHRSSHHLLLDRQLNSRPSLNIAIFQHSHQHKIGALVAGSEVHLDAADVIGLAARGLQEILAGQRAVDCDA
jgi:hypothetical protein